MERNQNFCQEKIIIKNLTFEMVCFLFVFMRAQTFEFLKKSGISRITFFRKVKETNIQRCVIAYFFLKYGFSQITFFRKVKETKIHFENFLKFDSSHFGI